MENQIEEVLNPTFLAVKEPEDHNTEPRAAR